MKVNKRVDAALEGLLDFDDRARKVFEPHLDTFPLNALDYFSKIGDQPELRLMAAAMLAAGTFSGSDRLVRAGARMMIAHEAATFVKDRVKTSVDRTRPRSATTREQKKPRKGRHTTTELNSFPSGHSAGAIAAARAVSREFPEMGTAVVGVAIVVALCQIPRCAHYPSDVAAGLAIGLASEALVDQLWQATSMDERSV